MQSCFQKDEAEEQHCVVSLLFGKAGAGKDPPIPVGLRAGL